MCAWRWDAAAHPGPRGEGTLTAGALDALAGRTALIDAWDAAVVPSHRTCGV